MILRFQILDLKDAHLNSYPAFSDPLETLFFGLPFGQPTPAHLTKLVPCVWLSIGAFGSFEFTITFTTVAGGAEGLQ